MRALERVRQGWRGPYEVALFVAAYLTYFGVRALTEGDVGAAVENARGLLQFEQSIGLAWETAAQQLAVESESVRSAANAIYIWGHWPVLIIGGILLFNLSRRHYYRLRNVCLLSGAIGLFLFAFFPVAPPRLSGLGFIDTVTLHAGTYRDLFPPSFVNEYAAMPSFHAGWDLMLGIALWQASARVLVRTCAVIMPTAMGFATVATANHFVVDVVAGAAIVAAAVYVVERFEPKGPPPRLDMDETTTSRAFGPGSHPVRRGPSGRERSGAPQECRGRTRAAHRS